MKKKLGKKIAVFAIVTALVVAMLPILTFADGGVAKIGTTEYLTLNAAVEAAGDGDTITLLKDVTDGTGIKIDGNKFPTSGLTIDFGGYTYTGKSNPVGSSGTENQLFQLNQKNKITFKNGKLNVDVSAKASFRFLIQNYSDLTLDGMELDGTNLDISTAGKNNYSLSNNKGTTVIKDTKIIAPTGTEDFAFDSYDDNSYEGIPTVTVKGDSEINGNVELGGGNINLDEGTLNGKLAGTEADLAKVTKKDTFDAAPPEGYLWDPEGKLVKATDIPATYAVKTSEEVYETLADAVKVIKDGAAIILLKNNKETVTVDRALSFVIQAGEFKNEATVKAADGFEIKTEKSAAAATDTKYIVTAKVNPQTADANNWILWAVLCVVALGAAVTVVARRKEN